MRRNLPRLLLTGALLSPVTLYALGLGEIRLNSALNQPFDADIELIAPTREELADLKVGLAANELFARYGLDRPAYLSNFNFAVSRSRDGQVTVKVSSNRSVTEPFVTFLVEANWGRGRLLREYTVLLDPPMFMPSQPDAAAAPVTAPQSGVSSEGRIVRARPSADTPPVPTPAEPARAVPAPESARTEPRDEPVARPTPAPAAVDGSYTVERNDTLSKIAARVQPGSTSRVLNQTMIALFRANSAAFAGNINRLRAGSVLRVPELADIEAISASEASAEVARQREEWGGAVRTASDTDANRLRLVTPAETPTAPTPAAPGPKVEAIPSTAATPAPTTAAPAAVDKRLQVTNPGLATAQQNATETPPPVAQPAPTAEQPPATAEPAQQPPAENAPPPRPRPQVAAAPAEPERSILDRIGDYWMLFVGAGVLVLVGLLAVFLKRKRDASEADAVDAYPPMTFEPRVERESRDVFGKAAPKARDRGAFVVDSQDDDLPDFDEPAPVTARRPDPPRTRPVEPRATEAAEIEAPTAVKRNDDTLSSETAVRFDQQDALAEADFHMAYGLYDQAADLVKIAIGREPNRRDLKLKLLEIYFVWGNRELFLETARELFQSRDQATASGEWDKVLIMGKQIAPEDSMFKGEAGSAPMDLVDVNLEGGENRVDVDLFAEPEGTSEGLDLEFGSGERKAAGADSDLDFMLDEQKLGADDEPTREMDPLARTQETPTIESPALDRAAQTIRERVDKNAFNKNAADQTAELSLDDLGLDVDALEQTGSLEETASLERDSEDHTSRMQGGTRKQHTLRDDEMTQLAQSPLRDDEMTQLAPSLGSLDRTLEAPRVERDKFDMESTGTIYIDQVDLSAGGDTVEQPRMDVDSTASMKSPLLDLDLDSLSGEDIPPADTVRAPRKPVEEADRFSDDVFADRTSEVPKFDLDVGDALSVGDHEPTNKVVTNEMELSELEPVTMSEVGTKLDLARAYMDMGDPDGARSILEEVLAEGTANQKQEAQRLLDSIR